MNDEKMINNWLDYDLMVKRELKGTVINIEDTYIYKLQDKYDDIKGQLADARENLEWWKSMYEAEHAETDILKAKIEELEKRAF